MKRFLALTMAMIMVVAMLSGCAPTDKPTEPTNPTTPVDPAKPADPNKPAEPSTGGKERTDIVLGAGADVVSPDPHNQNDTSSARVLSLIYDPLIRLKPDGATFEPRLATDWEVKSPTEYVFNLRKGVKFHNGDELTAADVKFSIERCGQSAMTKQVVDCVDTVEVTGDYQVTVKTKYPFAPFLFNVSSSKLSILNEKYTTEQGDKFKEKPMGTGPMKFEQWVPNDFFKVVRFDEYWEGAVKTTSVKIRVIPEPSSRTIALETGEVDFLDAVPPIDIKRVVENQKLKTVEQVGGSVTYVGMNYAQEPYNNPDVRKALAYAVNRDNVIEVIREGYGLELNTVFPPMMPGYDDTIEGYPYSVEKAKEHLAKAGMPNGFKAFMQVSGDERNRIAQLLQSDYKEIGVELDIELLEWGAFLDAVAGTEHKMFILGWSNAYNPDGNMFDTFHTSRPSTTNRTNFRNDEVSALIDKARQEVDWAKREPMYKELQKIIMAEPVWAPLFAAVNVIGMNKNLEGVLLEPITDYNFTNCSIKE